MIEPALRYNPGEAGQMSEYMQTGEKNIVYIVDDDPAVRHALSAFLEATGFTVRKFASAEAFLVTVNQASRGVVILDQQMKGMCGLELQAELQMRQCDLKVIFITGYGDVPKSVQAMKAGAVNFLEKPFSNEVLQTNVQEALVQTEADYEERKRQRAIEKRCESLTPREQEVMQYLVKGISNRHVAEHLELSTRTIEVHRSRIMAKMAADSLADLVRMVELYCNHIVEA